MNFTFGGNTPWTYEQLQRRRQIADAMMEQMGTPRNVGEGLSSIGKALMVRGINRRGDTEESRMRDEYEQLRDAAFGGIGAPAYVPPFMPGEPPSGGAPLPAVATAPLDTPNPAGLPQGVIDAVDRVSPNQAQQAMNYPASLIQSESGGNWGALNSEGYGGRLQFGTERLADAARAGVIPAGMTGADFSRLPPEQQMAVEAWHFADIDRQAQARGLTNYIGQTVNGAPITQNAIRAVAHIGGIGGAERYLESGGQYNPSDSNGTSLQDYALAHGGAGGAPAAQTGPAGGMMARAPGGGGMNLAALAEVMGSPFATPGEQFLAQSLIQQQLSLMDPMAQMQLAQMQMQMQQAQNPPAAEPPAAYQALEMRAQAAGLQPGTPEYQQFMLEGDAPQAGQQTIVMGPDGNPVFMQGTDLGQIRLTEGQSRDNVYSAQMRGALEVFDGQTEGGGFLGDVLTSRGDQIAGAVPFALGRGMQDPNYQVAEVAGQQFLMGLLRKETGAAITPDEMSIYGSIYLPQPGDTPEVLTAKREARIRAINAVESGMGPAQILMRDQALVRAAQEAAALGGNAAPTAPAPQTFTYNPETGALE